MEHSLEQADILRDRLDATYSEAKAALEACEGDLLGALAYIEHQRDAQRSDAAAAISAVLEEMGKAAREGRITEIRLRMGDAVLTSVPVALVGWGAALAVGLGALLTSCTVEFERDGAPRRDDAERRAAEGTDAQHPDS